MSLKIEDRNGERSVSVFSHFLDILWWRHFRCKNRPYFLLRNCLLWCAPSWQRTRPSNAALRVGCDTVQPARCVRDLGIYIDSDVSMRTHILRTVSNCFFPFWQLWSIRRSIGQPVLLSLVTSLILTRLEDYDSATQYSVPGRQLNWLQSVLNAAACLVCHAQKHDHVSHLLRDVLHCVSKKFPLLNSL